MSDNSKTTVRPLSRDEIEALEEYRSSPRYIYVCPWRLLPGVRLKRDPQPASLSEAIPAALKAAMSPSRSPMVHGPGYSAATALALPGSHQMHCPLAKESY